MTVLGIIPARYESSRLPGKPLVDICGKPMIWWTYQRVKSIQNLQIIAAIDNDKVAKVCEEYDIPFLMTKNHPTHIHRMAEVSDCIDADWYVSICGDEPLIESEVITEVIPQYTNFKTPEVITLCRTIENPTELIDPGNIKASINQKSEVVYLSRTPIPYPYKTVKYEYYKTIGVECFNKNALDFYRRTEKGNLEKIEDIALLRFLENRMCVRSKKVNSNSLSVDTERDLEVVRQRIADSIVDFNF